MCRLSHVQPWHNPVSWFPPRLPRICKQSCHPLPTACGARTAPQHPASCILHPASSIPGLRVAKLQRPRGREARVGARGERKERRGPARLVLAAAFAPGPSSPASPARLQDGGFPGHLPVLHQLLPGAQLCLAAVQRHVYLPRREYPASLASFSIWILPGGKEGGPHLGTSTRGAWGDWVQSQRGPQISSLCPGKFPVQEPRTAWQVGTKLPHTC